jgi:hypothetical protein
MNDDAGASVPNFLPESCGIEHIDQNRFDSEVPKEIGSAC